jgi:hypothetical protein
MRGRADNRIEADMELRGGVRAVAEGLSPGRTTYRFFVAPPPRSKEANPQTS